MLVRQTPKTGDWTASDHLLAGLVDLTNWLVWSKTEDGAKNRNQPKPLPRPGDSSPERIGSEAMTFAEADEWLGWNTTSKTDDGS